jgi:hypothetical protein
MSNPKVEVKSELTGTPSFSKLDFINENKINQVSKNKIHSFDPNLTSRTDTPTKNSKKFLLRTKSIKRPENFDHLMNRTNSRIPQQNKKLVLKNPFPLLTFLSNKFVLNNSKNLMTSLLGDHNDLRVMNIKSKIDREKDQPIVMKANLKNKKSTKENLNKNENFQNTFLTEKSNSQFEFIESILKVKKLNVRSSSNSSNFKTANSTQVDFPTLYSDKHTIHKTEGSISTYSMGHKNFKSLFSIPKFSSMKSMIKVDRKLDQINSLNNNQINSGLFLTAGKNIPNASSYDNVADFDNYYVTNPNYFNSTKNSIQHSTKSKFVISQTNSPKKINHKNQFSMDSKMRVFTHKYNKSNL